MSVTLISSHSIVQRYRLIIKAKSFRYAYPYMPLPINYKTTKELKIKGLQ